MYFPTEVKETYRTVAMLGHLNTPYYARDRFKEILGDTYNEIMIKALDSNLKNSNHLLFDYFLENERYDIIKELFTIQLGYSSKETVTVCDPFAGEGKWLETFKSGFGEEQIASKIQLIGNELEYNRYNTMKNNQIVDETYNSAYEQFNELPKGSVSVILYNPPYNDTNGVRNVKHYLQMIIDDKLLFNSKGSGTRNNGLIVMIIRKDDMLDSLPLIVEHFDVNKEAIYKVNEDEYKKYKQYVVYASLKTEPLDINNTNDALKLQQEVEDITHVVNSDPEFSVEMYDKISMYDIPKVPYEEMKKNYEIIEQQNYEKSNLENDNWKWIKDITEVKGFENEKKIKPTPLKTGEVANLIAAGMINGEMSINGQGNHIVAGGIKNEIREEIVKEEDNKGNEKVYKKKTMYSEPYLNILISENGKAKIKELSNNQFGGEI